MKRARLQMKSEAELASYQTRQVGNSCSFHVIAAAVRLLLNQTIDPEGLEIEINRLWWRGHFMRVAPNWAVTPRMQVRISKHLARTRGLSLAAEYRRSNPEALRMILRDPHCDCAPIITLIWLRGGAPPIYFANTMINFNRGGRAGGHTMLLAAYDPEHWAGDKFPTPWGFINPWLDAPTHLFWMAEADFRRAWGFRLPGVGPNPLVLLRRTGSIERSS